MINKNNYKYDYYHHKPCMPPAPGLDIFPGSEQDKAVAEHNLDQTAHPYLLQLFKESSGQYLCRTTVADRDAIPMESRSIGLMTYVYQTDKLYRLEDGIENNNWQELNVNSKKFVKMGRYNPPENPENGTTYFDFSSERIRVFLTDRWLDMPNFADLNQVKAELKAEIDVKIQEEIKVVQQDVSAVVDEKINSSLEDLYLTVDEQLATSKEEIKEELTTSVDEQLVQAKKDIKNDVVETVDDMLEEAENKWLGME